MLISWMVKERVFDLRSRAYGRTVGVFEDDAVGSVRSDTDQHLGPRADSRAKFASPPEPQARFETERIAGSVAIERDGPSPATATATAVPVATATAIPATARRRLAD